jgi:hypothetical protein
MSSGAQERLADALRRVMTLRAQLEADSRVRDNWHAVKRFQAERLRGTYPDLLASDKYHDACLFFLEELYGAHDFAQRDRQALTVVPKLARMLPERAVEAMAMAVELDHLSELLDARVAGALDADDLRRTSDGMATTVVPEAYADAYRAAGTPVERARQIALVARIGGMLESLARLPLLPSLLRLMRGPAEAAGFGHLHRFLESGFAAFRRMGPAREFLKIIERRESVINERLFGADPEPYRAVEAAG